MAYITTEQVREIRNQLKKEFSNLKFSVKKINYSKVSVTIKSGDLNFHADLKKINEDRDYITVWRDTKNQFVSDDIVKTLQRVTEIVYSQDYYDNSDAMTDYFDTAYYAEIKIGDWENQYNFNQAEKAA